MSLVSWNSVKSINPLPSLFFARSFGKNKNSNKIYWTNGPFPCCCKQRHQPEAGQNTVICMKLSTRASSSFVFVCSHERNTGKVY